MTTDTRLAELAPTRSGLSTWTAEREEAVLRGILDPGAGVDIVVAVSRIPLPEGSPAGRVPRWRRGARLAPVLAAACVVALALGLVTTFGSGREGSAGPQLPSRPWGARVVSSLALYPGSLMAHDGSVYGVTLLGDQLVEIDPGSGEVVARAKPYGSLLGVRLFPIFAGGRIWVAVGRGTRFRLLGYTRNLTRPVQRVVATPTLPRGSYGWWLTGNIAATAPADGSSLYVAIGGSILSLDPSSGRTRKRVEHGSFVTDLSVSPDGRTLYMIDRRSNEVAAIDAGTGRVTARYVIPDEQRDSSGSGSVGHLLATDAGAFVDVIRPGRHRLTLLFLTRRHPHGRTVHASASGGGYARPVPRAGGALWASGIDSLACLDPSTGRVRSATRLGGSVDLPSVSFVQVGTQLFGSYNLDPSTSRPVTAFVEFDPPAACGLTG